MSINSKLRTFIRHCEYSHLGSARWIESRFLQVYVRKSWRMFGDKREACDEDP